jgi:hypothetical protein
VLIGYPTEDELRKRITQHLQWRSGSDSVALIWGGYIAALLEWGLISPDVHGRLLELLPVVGAKELDELFLGEPITPEREREIDQFLAASRGVEPT